MCSTKKFFSLICAVMVVCLASCGFNAFEKKGGQIVFDFGGFGNMGRSGARNVVEELLKQDEDCFVDLTLEGSYPYTTTLNLRESSVCQIDDIPVGAQIKVIVEIYTGEKNVIASGQSDVYVIHAGINDIEVQMEEVKTIFEVKGDDDKQGITGDDNPKKDEEEEEVDPKVYHDIYVMLDTAKQNGGEPFSSLELLGHYEGYGTTLPSEEDGKDGQSLETAFNYIYSALNWIVAHGSYETDYRIILTGYENVEPFNQPMYFMPDLDVKAASITITSTNSDQVAINSSSKFSIYVNTGTPIIFKNIKISTSAQPDNNQASLIENESGKYVQIVLDKNAVLLGSADSTVQDGPAVIVRYGSFMMQSNSRIQGFNSARSGGAVRLDGVNHYITITDNAVITDCHTVENGGAIYLKNGTLLMSGGEISGCSATTGNGGAVYLDSQGAPVAKLSGGEIKNNTAKLGNAIYMTNNTSQYFKVVLSDNIYIDPSNDIYTAGRAISIKTTLTTQNPYAALISYSKDAIFANDGGCILILDNETPVDTDAIKNSYSKIAIRKYDYSNETYETNWHVNQNGQPEQNN